MEVPLATAAAAMVGEAAYPAAAQAVTAGGRTHKPVRAAVDLVMLCAPLAGEMVGTRVPPAMDKATQTSGRVTVIRTNTKPALVKRMRKDALLLR